MGRSTVGNGNVDRGDLRPPVYCAGDASEFCATIPHNRDLVGSMISGTVQHRVLGNIVAEQARRTFVGRERELSLLLKAINDDGYAVVYLHGIAGIGKSRLLSAFAERAHGHGSAVILIDCRAVEPTEQGFLRELGSRL